MDHDLYEEIAKVAKRAASEFDARNLRIAPAMIEAYGVIRAAKINALALEKIEGGEVIDFDNL